jgi:hypothetical protein
MKRFVFAVFAVAALAFPVCAQAPSAKVDVPFGFVAGDATMPAGTYVADISAGSLVVALVGADLHTHFLNAVPDGVQSGAGLGVLVFHRYGDQYFLSEIRTPSRSRKIPESRMEREAAKMASAGNASQEIVLAMR